LSPVEHSRKLDPLDAVFDSKPQEQTIKMCFHGALGDVQIASDFRIVTALKQQIDDLPIPLSYFSELLFHALTSTDALGPLHVANRPSGPMHTPGFVSLSSPAPCIRAANLPLPVTKAVKIHRASHFSLKNQRVLVVNRCVGLVLASAKPQFCADSKGNDLGQIPGDPRGGWNELHESSFCRVRSPRSPQPTGHDIMKGFPRAEIAFCDHPWTSN
jgi:hypothetical protein